MADRLETYRSKRDATRTPEPVPALNTGPLPAGNDDTFVIQEHHARRLHWDFRLEHEGVLVSWALPKGVPDDPKTNHLAVHTEDHPLDYAAFQGEIPKGEYGGGRVTIWDRGTYETQKWSDREVMVVLHGTRVSGRYVLFATKGKNWMIHRMDPPADPDADPLPESLRPIRPVQRARLPRDQDKYGFEFAWGGRRLIVLAEYGSVRIRDGAGHQVEQRELTDLGSYRAVFDGELIESAGQTVYMIFDLVHLDGRSLITAPYVERRRRLDDLNLAGPHWQTAPWFEGAGEAVRQAARDQGLSGILAKRLDAPYEESKADWRLIQARQ